MAGFISIREKHYKKLVEKLAALKIENKRLSKENIRLSIDLTNMSLELNDIKRNHNDHCR